MIAGPLFLYSLTAFTAAQVQLPADLAARMTAAALNGIAN